MHLAGTTKTACSPGLNRHAVLLSYNKGVLYRIGFLQMAGLIFLRKYIWNILPYAYSFFLSTACYLVSLLRHSLPQLAPRYHFWLYTDAGSYVFCEIVQRFRESSLNVFQKRADCLSDWNSDRPSFLIKTNVMRCICHRSHPTFVSSCRKHSTNLYSRLCAAHLLLYAQNTYRFHRRGPLVHSYIADAHILFQKYKIYTPRSKPYHTCAACEYHLKKSVIFAVPQNLCRATSCARNSTLFHI